MQMNEILKLFFSLVNNAVNSYELDENVIITDQDAEKLYELSKIHDMAHLVYYAIEKNSIPVNNEEILKKFKKQLMLAVLRYENQKNCLEQIRITFNELSIKFVALKGAVIRDLYPESWMRTGSDIDVLVEKDDIKKAQDVLIEKCGYSLLSVGSHDVSLLSPEGVHFELHFSLLDIKNDDEYLKNIWKYVRQKDTSLFEYELCDDIFYYYHIYHMAKHFLNGGCGIKPFLDMWVIKKQNPTFNESFKRLVSTSRFSVFAEKMEEQCDVWFGACKQSDISNKIQHYIINGGVYGSTENKQAMKKHRKKAVFSYYLSRIWLPASIMKLQYPKLEKNVWMLPFYQFKRWFGIIFSLEKYIKNEFVPVQNDTERNNSVSELKKELGL